MSVRGEIASDVLLKAWHLPALTCPSRAVSSLRSQALPGPGRNRSPCLLGESGPEQWEGAGEAGKADSLGGSRSPNIEVLWASEQG